MNKNFWLKGFQVKAIIISLSLALPVVVMAQTYSRPLAEPKTC